MKIYDTKTFEKLKIQQISIDNLPKINHFGSFMELNLDDMSFEDVVPGYVVYINLNPDPYIVVNADTMYRLFDKESYYWLRSSYFIVHRIRIKNSKFLLKYIKLNDYKQQFPHDYSNSDYDIARIFKPDILKDYFDNIDDFVKYCEYVEKEINL